MLPETLESISAGGAPLANNSVKSILTSPSKSKEIGGSDPYIAFATPEITNSLETEIANGSTTTEVNTEVFFIGSPAF